MNTIQDLERLVAAIEKQGANVAPTYQEYMPIAFAIANDCGEAGRSLFHRICRISEKYVSDEADRLFDHALKGGKRAKRNRVCLSLGRDRWRKTRQATGRYRPELRRETARNLRTCKLAALPSSHTHLRT